MITFLRAFLAVLAASFATLLALPILILAVPFWTVAFLTRQVVRLIEPKVVSWQQLIEYDSALGWKPRPALDTHCVSEFGGDAFHVATDLHGWAGNGSVAESEVVVFGDSFAFGYGVNARSSFSQVDPDLRIKAIGAPGYNLVQELLLMRQYAPQLQGKLVVWFIYVGNDLCENLQPNMQNYRAPFVRTLNGHGTWEIVTSHVKPAKWWPYRLVDNLRAKERFAGIFGDTFLTERIYSACDYLIREGQEVCTRAGARLVVMTIPVTVQLSQGDWKRKASGTEDLNRPDEEIGAICGRFGVPFVAAKDHLKPADYIPGEGHWNERGHRQIAGLLKRLYHESSGQGNGRNGLLVAAQTDSCRNGASRSTALSHGSSSQNKPSQV